MNGSLRAQCIAEFLGTGLFLFFGICCLSALKLTGASLGLWEICIIWGLGISLAVYLTAGISGGHRPVAVCLLPGQKSGALYPGSGRRRVWRRRAGLDTLQHPVYAI